jgi:hypothetical protein
MIDIPSEPTIIIRKGIDDRDEMFVSYEGREMIVPLKSRTIAYCSERFVVMMRRLVLEAGHRPERKKGAEFD